MAGSDDEPEEEQIVDDDLYEGHGAQENAREEERAAEDPIIETIEEGEDPDVAVLADEPDPQQEEADVGQQRVSTAVQNPERDSRQAAVQWSSRACSAVIFAMNCS